MNNEIVPYADIEKMGKAVATSGLFGVKTEAQAVALMLIAQAYGKHPAVAAMEYNIINNRPSKKAEAMLASFQEAGGKVKWIELNDKKAKAEFSHPSGGTLELEWTIEMAQKAGLIDKEYSNYKKYPRAMLRSRVVSEGVRAVYPAATSGMLSKEEAEDIVEPDATKSRVENIIDAQIEPKNEVIDAPKNTNSHVSPSETKPQEVSGSVQSPAKKSTSKKEGTVNKEPSKTGNENLLPAGHHQIQGIIKEIPPAIGIGEPPKPKWVYVMGDAKLGTFDEKISFELNKIIKLQGDTPILLNIEYKDRETSTGKIVKDIVKFSQATQVPI